MPWGAAIAAAGSIAGGLISSKGAKDASGASAQTQMDMFRLGLEETAPYREFGLEGLESLRPFLSQEGQAEELRGFYGGPLYGALEEQSAESILRRQAQTGGMRSGDAQYALSTIAPQLGMDYLNNQYDKRLGLANIGVTTSGAVPAQAGMVGANVGATQAMGIRGQADAYSNLATDLAGIGYGMYKDTI